MREILFRAKSKHTGEWVTGHYMKDSEGTHYVGMPKGFFVDPERSDFDGVHEIDPFTLGQYIGLSDKKEVNIFDGDVVMFTNLNQKRTRTMVVKWDEYNPCFVLQNIENHNDLEYDFLIVWCTSIEIIGNIHDNPELLTTKS